VHSTNGVQIIRNTCFNTYGHAFFLEDGNEVGNALENNIAIQVRKTATDRALLTSDFKDGVEFRGDPNRFPAPAGFWYVVTVTVIMRQ
jgi:cell migration-inducing and hyaluronan-binding protein